MNAYVVYLVLIAVALTNARQCPSGFPNWYRYGQLINGYFKPSCYMFVRSGLTWIEARRNCIKHGADLVSIETNGENAHLQEIIKRHWYLQKPVLTDYRYWGYWTGGNDQRREGDWRWGSNNNRFTFRRWSRGKPDNKDINGREENCLQLYRNSGWRWNDLYCSDEFQGSICEIKAKK